MDQENNNGLKPINASLIPGASILKSTLKLKTKHELVVSVQIGPARSDESNRIGRRIKALSAAIEDNLKRRNLKWSVHDFARDVIERELIKLHEQLGIVESPSE